MVQGVEEACEGVVVRSREEGVSGGLGTLVEEAVGGIRAEV